ncbi:hypothetical protein [Methylophilus sp. Leaf414]|uniref:hypothetical protein n=1 Tax=Methylophilus sp. Leaf414 TaxID=1736371 RepID=UPI0006F40DBF|nr:hypothetical protein [Methylophilus sp. Leaf414]KQT34502.1 hypothetical protein ASG24_12420 [Methylophilus sp. Leaf414]
MAGYALIEEVKKKTGITSDNQIAEAIGKHRSNVSAWKRTEHTPDSESVLKLCILGQIEPKRALELMQGGYASLSLMAMTGIASLALLASHPIISTVYYVK